jgi:hypothetical protein
LALQRWRKGYWGLVVNFFRNKRIQIEGFFMRNMLFFVFAFLLSSPAVAMDDEYWVKPNSSWPSSGNLVPAWPVSAKPVSGGTIMASLGSEDDLFRVVSLDTNGAPLNVSNELNRDFIAFLNHISGRVEEIKNEITAHKDPRNDSFDHVAASVWSFVKSKARFVQTTLKNPASEEMALALIKKIKEANEIKSNNAEYEWQIDTETQELVTTVQGSIDILLDRYRNDEFVFIRTQMEYLVEYKERIGRVNRLMGGCLK